MPRAFLSLGSNLGDRLALLREALERLARLEAVEIVGASPLYEAEPWESEPGRTRDETRWYLNCVVAVETTLPPRALLERVQAIETALGRTRPSGTPEARRFAARTLDIDILLYGREVVSVPDDLHIPHLLLAERAFVLRPLADLAPDVEHPTLYRTIRDRGRRRAGLGRAHVSRRARGLVERHGGAHGPRTRAAPPARGIPDRPLARRSRGHAARGSRTRDGVSRRHRQVEDLQGEGTVARVAARLQAVMNERFSDASDEELGQRLRAELPRYAAPARLSAAIVEAVAPPRRSAWLAPAVAASPP